MQHLCFTIFTKVTVSQAILWNFFLWKSRLHFKIVLKYLRSVKCVYKNIRVLFLSLNCGYSSVNSSCILFYRISITCHLCSGFDQSHSKWWLPSCSNTHILTLFANTFLIVFIQMYFLLLDHMYISLLMHIMHDLLQHYGL